MLPSLTTAADLHALLPEIFLCAATFALLMVDLFLSPQRRGLTHFMALVILAATAMLTVRDMSVTGTFAFSHMFVRDIAGDVLKIAVYLVTAMSFVYAKPYLQERDLFKGEFYVLGLFAVLGMTLMISAASLTMLYLGLELLALSSYGLVAIDRDSRVGSEAAMKYFVLGAMASGLLLYGMSMVYGASGSLRLDEINVAAASGQNATLMMLGVVFMLAGICFKFGAAPFHMWLPDVYQGAPTAVTLFIGSAPKLAAFAMAYRLLESGVGPVDGQWREMIAWLAALSLIIGNLVALVQGNFKRMLAYSTISHVGFLFMGLANATAVGYAAAMFYAISYSIMSAAAFASIILLSRRGFEAEQISDFRGLWQRSPLHAFMVLFVMASMAGIPPFLGFFAKLQVIVAALDGGMQWLAILGVVCAVIGAFYYLKVIRAMFFEQPEGEGPQLNGDSHLRAMFTVNAAALLVLGLYAQPLLEWCRRAFPA